MPRELRSFEQLHRLVPALIGRLNKQPELAARAMANPLLALEELDIRLTPKVRKEAEYRIRFPESERAKADALDAEVARHAGRSVDAESSKDLENLLFRELRLERAEGHPSLDIPVEREPWRKAVAADTASSGSGNAERARSKGAVLRAPSMADPIEHLKGAHPVIAPLLARRELARRFPGFASASEYQALKRSVLPVEAVRLRLPADHLAPDRDDA